MRINRRSTPAFVLLLALALSLAPALSATADETPVDVTFTTPSATVEYGQGWSFEFTAPTEYYQVLFQYGYTTISSSGTPSGYTPMHGAYLNGGMSRGYVVPPDGAAPLAPGNYSFELGGTTVIIGNTYTVTTPVPATLTVEKAKLGIELRVLADPISSGGAIVTAKFTGRFVDEYSSSFFPGVAQSPAGTWNVSIKDKDGEVATERSVERAAGDDVLATSFYWADAEPGEQYTASASFTPSGVSANNFTIGAAQNFSYTAPESARPVPTSSATAKPDASLPEATGFGLPLWALILVIVLIVGLGVLVTILSVRLSRRPSTSTGEVQP